MKCETSSGETVVNETFELEVRTFGGVETNDLMLLLCNNRLEGIRRRVLSRGSNTRVAEGGDAMWCVDQCRT